MALNPQQLPYQVTGDPITGGNSRATQNVFASMPRFASTTIDTSYVEPLALKVDAEPLSIELVRIIDLRAPSTPVLCGSLCHWTFLPAQGGALIASIDGLTSDPTTKYRLTFLVTYKAQV